MSAKSSSTSLDKNARQQAQQGILAALANHRTAPNLIMICMVVGGLWALSRINFQLFPELVVNYLQVTAIWPGASPTDVDESVVDDLLPVIQANEDVNVATSYAGEGAAFFVVELSDKADQDKAAGDLKTALDAVALPTNVEAPAVNTFIPPEHVASILISAPFSETELLRVAEQVKDGLTQAGVSKVSVSGVRHPVIQVVPDQAALAQLGLGVQEVGALVGRHTADAPSGALGDSGTLVRSIGRANNRDEVAAINVLNRPDGSVVRLEDIATVTQIFPDSGAEVRRNFNRSVEVHVSRSRGESTLQQQDIVTGLIGGMTGQPRPETGWFGLPVFENARMIKAWDIGAQAVVAGNVSVETYDVAADFIRNRLNLLVENGALGLVIVLVLLAVFLNLRTAIWVAVGIPVSFAATFAVMYLTGQTINLLSTFGLLITLGIIVDDAIVVGEHADELASGDSRRRIDGKFRPTVMLGGVLFTVFLAILIGVAVLAGVPSAADWPLVGSVVEPLQNSLLPVVLTLALGMFLSVMMVGIRLTREFPVTPQAGLKPREAAVLAAQRMAAPVSAAAITTLISFAVLVLIGGRLASFIAAIPLAVMAVLIASLLECFFVLPGHMRHALEARNRQKDRWYGAPLKFFRIGFDWLFDGFRFGIFRRLVQWAVVGRYLVIGVAVACFILAIGEVARQNLRFTFFRGPSDGTISIDFDMIESANRDDTRAHIDNIQRATEAAFAQTGVELAFDEAVDMIIGRVGIKSEDDQSGQEVDPDRVGSVSVYILDAFQEALEEQIKHLDGEAAFQEPADYFADLIRKATPVNPRLSTQRARPGSFDGGGGMVDVRLLDAEPDVLKQAALALAERLEAVEGIGGVSDNMPFGEHQLELVLTQRGRSLGVDVQSMSAQVRAALARNDVYSISVDGLDVSVVVELLAKDKNRDFLEGLLITTNSGAQVPLAQIATFRETQGFDVIIREQNRRQISVTAQMKSDSPISSRDLADMLQKDLLPKLQADFPVSTELAGSFQDEQEFFMQAAISAVLALVGIYLVLCWVFSSFWRPFVIMAIIPMGFVGMVYGHLIHGVDLTMFSVIGFMGLSGIIVNDSIVLISTIDRRAKTQSPWQAAVWGSVDRLRAVLLTSATTIGGLLPLMFERSTQADFLLPTTLTIVYGLGLGTAWVLFLVPAMVGVQADFAANFRSLGRMRRYLFGRKRGPLGQKAEVLPVDPWRKTTPDQQAEQG